MNKLLFAALLVAFSTMLGATVFRDQVAEAAQLLDVHITNLDAGGNVKVHEQGTAQVTGTVGLAASANTVRIDPASSPVHVAAATASTVRPFARHVHVAVDDLGDLHFLDRDLGIPPNTLFVVKQISVDIAIAPDETPYVVWKFTGPNSTSETVPLPVELQLRQFSTYERWVSVLPTELYVAPETTSFVIDSGPGHEIDAQITADVDLSGYLIDA